MNRSLTHVNIARLYNRQVTELGFVLALLLILTVFIASQSHNETRIVVAKESVPHLEIEEIPITVQIKKPARPKPPTTPIEDPEVGLEDNIPMPNFDKSIFGEEMPPPPPPLEEMEPVPFWAVEVAPEMIGGRKALYDYLATNNLYPEMALNAGIGGVAIIEFVVSKEGIPTELIISAEDPSNLGFGQAALKAVAAMTFTPGQQRDRAVPVRMNQVIQFKLK
jgi:TonB family protein